MCVCERERERGGEEREKTRSQIQNYQNRFCSLFFKVNVRGHVLGPYSKFTPPGTNCLSPLRPPSHIWQNETQNQ